MIGRPQELSIFLSVVCIGGLAVFSMFQRKAVRNQRPLIQSHRLEAKRAFCHSAVGIIWALTRACGGAGGRQVIRGLVRMLRKVLPFASRYIQDELTYTRTYVDLPSIPQPDMPCLCRVTLIAAVHRAYAEAEVHAERSEAAVRPILPPGLMT